MGARRRLATAVHVEHPVTHERVLLLPGDDPDPELAELITHPDAWEDASEAEPEKPRRKPNAKAETG